MGREEDAVMDDDTVFLFARWTYDSGECFCFSLYTWKGHRLKFRGFLNSKLDFMFVMFSFMMLSLVHVPRTLSPYFT